MKLLRVAVNFSLGKSTLGRKPPREELSSEDCGIWMVSWNIGLTRAGLLRKSETSLL